MAGDTHSTRPLRAGSSRLQIFFGRVFGNGEAGGGHAAERASMSSNPSIARMAKA
jgi:hypothetical protein